MGSRANAVIIENDKRLVMRSHGAAQDIDMYMFWGPDIALRFLSYWNGATTFHAESGRDPWYDPVWAEGACCVDLDNKHLLLYGGEATLNDILYNEIYMRMLPLNWPGWTTEWAWGELGQIAKYAGVEGDSLSEIDRVPDGCYNNEIERIEQNAFDFTDRTKPACSTVSMMKDGVVKAAFSNWENVREFICLDKEIIKIEHFLELETLYYDEKEFPLSGLHFDYDKKEIHAWHTWDCAIPLKLSDYWEGWNLYDYRFDYKKFYKQVEAFISLRKWPEASYIKSIQETVCVLHELGYPEEELSYSLQVELFDELMDQYEALYGTNNMLPILE